MCVIYEKKMLQKQAMQGDQSEQKDAARLKKLLKNLDPEHKHLEDIQAKRVGYAIKILNDNVKLVSVIAALCDEFKVALQLYLI